MPISIRLSPQLARVSTDLPGAPLTSCSTHSQQDCRKQLKAAPAKKSVRFAANETSVDSSYNLSTNEIKKDLWWSSEELKEHTKQWKAAAKKFMASQQGRNDADADETDSSLDKKLGALYKSCSTMNVPQVLRCKAHKEVLSDIVAANVRGLENKMSRMPTCIRKRHSQAVLSTVALACDTDTNENDDPELLRAKSAHSSRASQILAKVLAQLDARECQ